MRKTDTGEHVLHLRALVLSDRWTDAMNITLRPAECASGSLRDQPMRATPAPTTVSVLVEGETGTGKELVAQAIHDKSDRARKPFVVIDCSAIPPSLAESTLFGHEKGAFTGAVSKRVSPFVEAQGGTVFLDELGELPLDVQPKLLRVLAEQRVRSVGANGYVPVNVRILAATRRDLLEEREEVHGCADEQEARQAT